MKKAFKTPYIGTRAELKRESIRNLKKLVAYLNCYALPITLTSYRGKGMCQFPS